MPVESLDSLRIEGALAAEAERAAADDEVGQNDFLTMLVAQLENQDPLNPQDSADFAAQLAQFSSVEQLIAMRAGIDELVAASSTSASTGGIVGEARSAVDPTNLIGREVTVFGSQIEVDAVRSPIELDFRNIDEAIEAGIVVRDVNGNVVHSESLVGDSESGLPSSLRPGDHVYRFDPREHNLPAGVYAVELTGRNATGEPVTLLPMIRGVVSGAILAGDPSIRMGGRVFRVEDVLEVNATERGASAGSAASFATGGGLQRVTPEPLAAPVRLGS